MFICFPSLLAEKRDDFLIIRFRVFFELSFHFSCLLLICAEQTQIQDRTAGLKQRLEIWQKYHENGEYLRSIESGTEENDNMIDGISNNRGSKRVSVLLRLKEKQKEVAARYGKAVVENEKEGGERCTKCFYLRLNKTAKMAKENGFDYFCTTLSVSPYKDSQKLNKIGKILEEKYNINYLYSDFKKKEGYKRSNELSRKYELYRQNYCGCKYSLNEITKEA